MSSSRRRLLPHGGAAAVLSLVMGMTLLGTPPASASAPDIPLAATPSTADSGSTVDLTASMPVQGAGTIAQEISQQIDPTKVKLTSASDITYPQGWTLSYSFDNGANWTTTAPTSSGQWATVTNVKASGSLISEGSDNGRQVASTVVSGAARNLTPASLIVSGGDGFQVFFDAERTRAFNIYHHTNGSLDCWVIATGARCAGFPFSWQGDGEEQAIGRVVGTNIWIQGADNATGGRNGTGGLFCVDISAVLANGGNPRLCTGGQINANGQLPLAAGVEFTNFAGATPVGSAAETKLYAVNGTTSPVTVHCIDTATKSTCGVLTTNIATGVAPANDYGNSVLWGNRLYVWHHSKFVTCVLVDGSGTCPGWSTPPPQMSLNNGKLFALPDSSGVIQAVCLAQGGTSDTSPCWDAAGTQSNAATYGFPQFALSNLWIYGAPVTLGSRVYIGNSVYDSISNARVICFDAAQAPNGNGHRLCNGATSLLAYTNYTVTPDPLIENCMWVTQHRAPVIASYDIVTGASGCGSVAPVRASFTGETSVPRMGCSSTGAIAGWRDFTLQSATGSFTGATLTVTNSSGVPISGWRNVPLTMGSPVSLPGLTVATTGQTPTFHVDFTGTSGSMTAEAKITAIGDAPQLCMEVTTIAQCPVTSAGPIPAATLGSATTTAISSGSVTTASSTTALVGQTTTITINPSAAQCLGTVQGTAVDTNATPLPVSGATVTLQDSAGNPVVYPNNWPVVALRGQPVTTVTASDGTYSFTSLGAGDYTVKFENSFTASVSSATVSTGGSGTTARDLGACLQGTAVPLHDLGAGNVLEQITGSEVLTREAPFNLVVNGDFTENGDGTGDFMIGQFRSGRKTLPGWTVTGGGPATYAARKNSNSGAPNGASGQWVYFGNQIGVEVYDPTTSPETNITGSFLTRFNSSGTTTDRLRLDITFFGYGQDTDDPVAITQSVPTVVGERYRLQFWQRGEPYGSNDGIAAVDIGAYDRTYFRIFRSVNYRYYTFEFVATATSTPISIMSWGHVGGAVQHDELGLDDVKVLRCSPTQTSVDSNAVSLVAGGTSIVNAVYIVEAKAVADTSSGAQGVAQTINVLANDSAQSGASKPTTGSPVKLCNPGESPACTQTTAVVPGQGVYVASAAGVVTFTPCSANNVPSSSTYPGLNCTGAFTGQATPVPYTFTDSAGRTASSTITPTVVPVPNAVNDSSTGAWNQTQSASVLENDDRAGASATFDTSHPPLASTLKLCPNTATTDAQCLTSTTHTVSGQGRYSLDRSTGVVSFSPCTASGVPLGWGCTGPFVGTPTPVKYSVADSLGQRVLATYQPSVTPPPSPTAASETKLVQPGSTITFTSITGAGGLGTPGGPPLNTTNTVSGSMLCTISPAQTPPNCSAGVVDVPGEGRYTLNRTTGVVTYQSYAGAAVGPKTPIRYMVRDNLTTGGRQDWATATLTPVIPGPPVAVDDTSSGAWDTEQVFDVLGNDSASLGLSVDRSSVKLCTTVTVDASCTGTSLTVANEGTYTVDPTTGAVTFDPLPTFTGQATPIKYVVRQSDGLTDSATITPTVSAPNAPTASDEGKVVLPGETVAFTTVDRSGGLATPGAPPLVSASTCLIIPASSPPTCDVDGVVTIAGEGTYTLNTATGVVSFAADPSASAGAKTPVTYKVVDEFGNSDTGVLTPTIPAPPTSNPDVSRGEVNTVQSVAPTGNDAPGLASVPLVPTSVKICAAASPQSACSGTDPVTIAGKGTFSVNPDGTVSFTPLPDVAGVSTVAYTVEDSEGRSTTNTITVTVLPKPAPSAVTDTKTGDFGQNIVFTPLTGTASAAQADSPGTLPADITGGPTGSRTGGGEVTTVESVQNLAFGAMALCAANESVPNCTQTSVTTVDGTYTLAGTQVTFAPAAGFIGTATTPVQYQVANAFDRVTTTTTIVETTTDPSGSCSAPSCTLQQINDSANVAPGDAGYVPTWRTMTVGTATVTGTPETASAYLIPTVNAPAPITADDETDSGAWNTPVSEDVTVGDTSGAVVDVSSVKLCGPVDTAPNCTQTSVSVPGEGTYIVNASGVVTFTPLASFSGVSSITYSIADGLGRKASARYSPTIAAPSPPTAADDAKSVVAGASVAFETLAAAGSLTAPGSLGTLDDAAACLIDPASSPAACDGDGVVSSDHGTYVLNPVSGVVTYTANANAPAGAQTPVSYRVIDGLGLTATAVLTPTVYERPTVAAKTGTDLVNTAQSFDALDGDTFATGFDITPASVLLCDPAVPDVAPDCSATTLTVAGEGTYAVDSTTGVITFTPDAGFVGTAQSVTYSATDGLNQKASNTISPIVVPRPTPQAVDDTASGNVGDTLLFTPDGNDVARSDGAASLAASVSSLGLDPTSIRLCDVGEVPRPTGAGCTATTITTVDGTYTVNVVTGAVEFTGAPLFTGTATNPVRYEIANTFTIGGVTESNYASALLVPTIIPPTPAPSGGSPASSSTPAPSTAPAPSTVEPSVEATPAVVCRVADCRDVTPVTATGPTEPQLAPQRASTTVDPDRPAKLNPWREAKPSEGHPFVTSSIRLWNGAAWVRRHAEAGVGVWRIVDGQVEFMPARGYVGTAVIQVSAIDSAGARAKARLSVVVRPRDGGSVSPTVGTTGRPGDVPLSIKAGAMRNVARCPDEVPGGVPVAWITVDGVTTPIKKVSYPAGGILEPPDSNRVAAISARHAPLDSLRGTSVLTWHVRYGPGCGGALNDLLSKTQGDTFTVRTINGRTTTYAITDRLTVNQGDYEQTWFDQSGPHRLALFTCAGLRDGRFTKTTAIFAQPIAEDVVRKG